MLLLFALVDTGYVSRISCCVRDRLAPKGKYTHNLSFGKSLCGQPDQPSLANRRIVLSLSLTPLTLHSPISNLQPFK